MSARSPGKNKKGVRFYEEKAKPHDLLFVYFDRKKEGYHGHILEGCSTAIRGEPLSVNWGQISQEFLYKKCRRITRAEFDERLKENRCWQILADRADWMTQEMQLHGQAVLPF